MMNKKIELLSPAGNLEKLKIAFAYGADAVYGGVSHFSLRIRSGKEFTFETFQEGIDYAHNIGKKVYVTINGFPFNSQIELLKEHIKNVAAMKPDALIVATPGVIALCRELAPGIPIHLSTQANVMNYLDAKVYYDMGVRRIIAAREISLKDVEAIKKELPDLEIEIFVHGSMCFAYSGRCLVSAVQMGRVPNRGSCANDCRFEYTLYAANEDHSSLFRLEEDPGVGTYIFNAKDMNLASHVDEILASGAVDSIKIEGRTKSPYYAAITAYTYKMAINDFYDGNFDATKYQKELSTTKNRGFTDAYLVHKPFEKNDTQNHDYALSAGSFEVSGLVIANGEYFMCKYKTYVGDEIEIFAPLNSNIEEVDNEIGSIYKKDDGKYYISFKRIVTELGKELESVHSGNTNPIKLPGKLPYMTMFRVENPDWEADLPSCGN
ncbi:MAG: U32 family peptidase [Campylobacteraceae bacterium]|nr:U32 family peptidase [Campylobacteraceae bacterium]MBT3882296.1 U32 family peptidase [Campylobacteraceae bacterium]MBT4030212.1 U32 family peptidase [Campylobacteraceae bacterium]MBT4179269.1 U32 family peptidase [Campylobacteraceae bacterium]MBT4572130.1 U32 family peptidase [Campylobacteraceae bacterium]